MTALQVIDDIGQCYGLLFLGYCVARGGLRLYRLWQGQRDVQGELRPR